MRMTRRLLPQLVAATLAGALALPAQAGLLAKMFETKASTPVVLSAPADATQTADFVMVEHGEKLAGKKKFALAGFTLEFQIMAKDYDSQFGSTVGSKTSMTMEGVSQADMQAITDKVYADFQKQMTEQGITLVTPAELSASPAWQKIAGMSKGPSYEMSAEKDKVLLLAPAGYTVIATHSDEETQRLGWGLSGLKALSSATLPEAEIALAKELGYPVMKVYYVVRFGTAKSVAISQSSRGSVKVSGLILGDGQTGISIRTEHDNPLPSLTAGRNNKQDGDSFVRLKTSITTDQNILAGDVRESGGVNKALGTALTMLTGAGTFTHDFIAPLDPTLYGSFATDTLSRVSGMFAAELKASAGK